MQIVVFSSSLPVPRVYLILYLSQMFLLFICLQSECVYALDKLRNTEGINHCHLAAQHVAHAARARVPCISYEPFLLSLTSMNFKLFQYINP